MQVKIKLPTDIPSSDSVAVTMQVGGWGPSPQGVTMAVR
jgi:hypothetical protein